MDLVWILISAKEKMDMLSRLIEEKYDVVQNKKL